MECKVIENFDDFLKLEQPWNELLSQTDVEHIYMKHQWFSEWIKAYNKQDTLAIVAIFRDGQLVAIAPLHRKPLRFKNTRARGISFLSSGISPRCNFISIDNDAMKLLIEGVFNLPDWDILDTENMELGKGVTDYYLEFLGSRDNSYSYYTENGFECYYIDIKGEWDDYWKSLSRSWRTNFKRYSLDKLRMVESHQTIHLREENSGMRYLDVMFDVSEKSWKASVDSHLVRDSELGRLYTSFTPIGLKNEWVYIAGLKINGIDAGYVYFLNHNDKYVGIRAEFDEQFKSCSPGNNLHLAIIRNLFESGVACEYDMGPDAPYKRNFCDKIKKHITVLVGNKNFKGRWIMFSKNHVMPALRRLKSSTGRTT